MAPNTFINGSLFLENRRFNKYYANTSLSRMHVKRIACK